MLAALAVVASALAGPAAADERPAPHDPPVLAYFYIWYNPTSWQRAKTDYPILGRYSSSEESVMRRQVDLAKASGIDGFIVSWKQTDILEHRLGLLAEIADEADLSLTIMYQGLDFERRPLPIARVQRDLRHFVDRWSAMEVFRQFEQPAVILSGSWEFTADEIDSLAQTVADDALLLASARNTDDYERVRSSVDGNAYYWSSVDPTTYPDHPGKLAAMSELVHRTGGLWIAPAAPGFDARPIGGTTVVGRRGGETFLTQWNAAMQSSPDAIGIISWNEFSENTHIEPSIQYGSHYLEVLADITDTPGPSALDFDSSAPEGRAPSGSPRLLLALGGLGLAVVASAVVVGRREAIRFAEQEPRDASVQ